ncbi:MAG TPA: hypothetical protein VFD59_11065 [Nocardioidaceae bacterium]|nr:hypothetical protein [Nocardioidaceae bacterium]
MLVVSGGSMRAYAESAVFHDDHDDVVNLETRTQTSVQAGIDVRDVALAFTDRAVLLTVQHENLTERNAHEGRADYLILDTNAGDPGPEWSMELIGFHYQLYRVKSHAQASDPKRHMRRYCGDKVRIDTRENTTWMRFPASCAPRATQVRAYGRFVSDERGYAPRADNFLGYRSWTPWVSKG